MALPYLLRTGGYAMSLFRLSLSIAVLSGALASQSTAVAQSGLLDSQLTALSTPTQNGTSTFGMAALAATPDDKYIYAVPFDAYPFPPQGVTNQYIYIYQVDPASGGLTNIGKVSSTLPATGARDTFSALAFASIPASSSPGAASAFPNGALLATGTLGVHVFKIGANGKLTEISNSPFQAPNGTPNTITSKANLYVDPVHGRVFLMVWAARPNQCDYGVAVSSFNIKPNGSLAPVGSNPLSIVSNATSLSVSADGNHLFAGGFVTINCGNAPPLPPPQYVGSLNAYFVNSDGSLSNPGIQIPMPVTDVPLGPGRVLPEGPAWIVTDASSGTTYVEDSAGPPFALQFANNMWNVLPAATPIAADTFTAFDRHGLLDSLYVVSGGNLQAYGLQANGALSPWGPSLPSSGAPGNAGQAAPVMALGQNLLFVAGSPVVNQTGVTLSNGGIWVYRISYIGFSGPLSAFGPSSAPTIAQAANLSLGCDATYQISLTGNSGQDPVTASAQYQNEQIFATLASGAMQWGTSYSGYATATCPPGHARGLSDTLSKVGTGNPMTYSYVVNSTADDTSGTATNCTSNPEGTCTLRDALAAAANTSLNTITFLRDSFGSGATITLGTGGSLTIPSNTTITGLTSGSGTSLTNLVTVSGNNQSQVFTVASGVTGAQIVTLNITNGQSASGGAISNSGTLTVANSTFSSNSATETEGYGGAIYNNSGATLTVTNCTFSSNSAQKGAAEGGAIENQGTLAVTNSTFNQNSAQYGGSIGNRGTMTIANSTFVGASAINLDGGAIFVISGTSGSATATVIDSTFSGHSANLGGAIHEYSGTLSAYNNIFTGNSCTHSCTSSGDCSATTGPAAYCGAGIYSHDGGASANSTVYFANRAGTTEDDSDNLKSNTRSTSAVNNPVGALYLNGGTTQTMFPPPGSAAICAGLASNVPLGIATDQRGFPIRASTYCPAGRIDAGAVQTNYTSVQFVQQPNNTTVNSAISPPLAVEIVETNLSNSATDTVANLSIPLTYSGGPLELAGGAASLTATTGPTTIGSSSVNAAVYTLTPNTTGSGFTFSAGATGAGIVVVNGTALTATSNPFNVQ
jgi:CSLREA domain-containing protein